MAEQSTQPADPLPRISIIIAVLNARETIRESLGSVLVQTHENRQLVVKDGGSTDGTLEVLHQMPKGIDVLLSGPDQGIYQAWNEALEHADGDYLCFLGADDRLADTDALNRLADAARGSPDLVTSRSLVSLPDGMELESGAPWDWLGLQGAVPTEHRGMLHHRRLFERHGRFDERFRIAGDYEFLLRCGPGLRAVHVPAVTVLAGGGGISHARQARSYLERCRAQLRHRAGGAMRPLARLASEWTRLAWYRSKQGVKSFLVARGWREAG